MAHSARLTAERIEVGPLWEDHGLVFPSERGTLWDQRNFRRAFNKEAAAAGLSDLHPHLLWHTAISLLSAAGVPLEAIADVAGHATTAMTEGVYRHPVAAWVSAHVRAAEALLGPGAASPP
ncbi:MAG: tyrosine-type recombinase/integrase [Acidimicrobiales bacterium]